MGLSENAYCVLKRRFQKHVTFINIIIRSRIMAKKTKLKKTKFWFFDHKRVNFQYFQNGKKLHTLQLYIFSVYEAQ